MKIFRIFGLKEDGILYFFNLDHLKSIEKLNFHTPVYCGPVGPFNIFLEFNGVELDVTSKR
jgi:hypothetical protein